MAVNFQAHSGKYSFVKGQNISQQLLQLGKSCRL